MLQLPDFTVQLNQILSENGKKRNTKKLLETSLILTKKDTNCTSIASTFKM